MSITRRTFIASGVPALLPAAPPARDKRAGVYVIWYDHEASRDKLTAEPYLKGGQIVLQWADVEPRRGSYDFSAVERQLAEIARRGWFTTIQINGNQKPAWLFDVTPYLPQKLHVQVKDERGTLMYWHPAHRDSYLGMLAAFSRFIGTSQYADVILGLRMNFNAIGTEHTSIPREYIALNNWTMPAGVSPDTLEMWTPQTAKNYMRQVVDAHVADFHGVIHVFVRNSAPEEIVSGYRKQFDDGTLSWFHTSSEVEPRSTGAEIQYKRFYEWCRSGRTTGYAEPWASAWGHHGGKTDDRWCSPPQWFYWRVLCDLHCGVSYVALYASDFRVAVEGVYRAGGVNFHDDGAYQREFQEAVRFADRYAGYHALPEASPGAWVAFRENHVVRAANGYPAARRKLSFLTSDYNFLMERESGDRSKGEDVVNIGPAAQRFGAWARILPAGDAMRLKLDAKFAASLKKALVRVTYLDESGQLEAQSGAERSNIRMQGSGRWQTATLAYGGGSQVELRAGGAPVHLHMVEVARV